MAVIQPHLAPVAGISPGTPVPGPASVPRLRQHIKLCGGPRHRDGSPGWRILDPVRNRFFEIGWLEFELLARWSEHGSVEELIAEVESATPLRPTDEEVIGFMEFLEGSQLLAPAEK